MYKNKEWLRREIKRKGVRQIAFEEGVSIGTIYYYLRKFRIVLPSQLRERKYQNKEWLAKMIKDYTPREIAEICGVWPATIISWLHRFDLPVASPKKPLNIELSPEAQEFLDALLLNGAYFNKGNHSASLAIRDESFLYLEWVKNKLQKFGILAHIRQKRKSYILSTRFFTQLYFYCLRWRKKEKTVLPNDFSLTPTIALIWFLHKGHNEMYSKRGKRGYTRALRLWILRFPKKDRERLIKEIQERIGIKDVCLYQSNKIAMIRIPSVESEKFFDYIGDCPPELESTFGLKWKIGKGLN